MNRRTRDELAVLRKLRELTARVALEGDPEKLVPLILESAIELTGAERGFIVRGTTTGGKLSVAHSLNMDKEAVQNPDFKVSRSIVQRVAKTAQGECITDAEEDERTRHVTSVRDMGLRSILCVPLQALGKTLGVVYVDHRYVKGQFDAHDLATLEAFAVPAAVVLDARERSGELARSRDEAVRRLQIIEQLRAELAERYRERSRELDRARAVEPQPREPEEAPLGIIARSPSMRRILDLVRKVAPSDAAVLIVGESGVGKEILARALHALSPRARGPFVAESCAALAETLLESELFGHEAGSFTGAVRTHAGLFETARGGTLFLDEIGEMSAALQAKLLRVLQEREVRRVGGSTAIPIDVRVVGATHRDLEALIAAGRFRQDLYYRLNVVRIDIPPLRERPEDVPPLLDRNLEPGGDRSVSVDLRARELLLAYAWPGNVRELANECHRLRILAGPGGVVRPSLLSPAILGAAGFRPNAPGPQTDLEERPIEGLWRLDEVEKEMLRRALHRAQGNKTLAAKLLGVPKTSLYHMIEKYDMGEKKPS